MRWQLASLQKGKNMIRISGQSFDSSFFDDKGKELVASLGLQKSGRYAVCFESTSEWLALFFAIQKLGASVLPLHPSTPINQAVELAKRAGCSELFFNSLTPQTLEVSQPFGPREGCLIQMSSGTTGAAKCISRSWAEIDREIESYVSTFTQPDDMQPIIACPVTHSYGLICGLLVSLKRGQEPHVLETGNPKHILSVLRETECPLIYTSPAVLHILVQLLPKGETLFAAMTSGTLLPEPWFAKIRDKTKHLFQQYGCSEAGCVAINPDLQSAGEMGFALPHVQLGAGKSLEEAGDITIRTKEGAQISTRDLGYLRADGMLVFVSRLDDMINVAGLNVYPKDVEDVVMQRAGVLDAVVFRRKDVFSGERPALLFSLGDGGNVTPAELRDWCAKHLSAHQVPMTIQQVAQIPRQANGKISRRAVSEAFANGELQPLNVKGAS
jgi:acyl-CoA synthetase (AMP-forming)/AMP-acid ligase II